jgi:hypothetical protein
MVVSELRELLKKHKMYECILDKGQLPERL